MRNGTAVSAMFRLHLLHSNLFAVLRSYFTHAKEMEAGATMLYNADIPRLSPSGGHALGAIISSFNMSPTQTSLWWNKIKHSTCNSRALALSGSRIKDHLIRLERKIQKLPGFCSEAKWDLVKLSPKDLDPRIIAPKVQRRSGGGLVRCHDHQGLREEEGHPYGRTDVRGRGTCPEGVKKVKTVGYEA